MSLYTATCPVCGERKSTANLALVFTRKGIYRACPGLCRLAIEYRDKGMSDKAVAG